MLISFETIKPSTQFSDRIFQKALISIGIRQVPRTESHWTNGYELPILWKFFKLQFVFVWSDQIPALHMSR